MPLATFADQVMALFQQTPAPQEILVEGVDYPWGSRKLKLISGGNEGAGDEAPELSAAM